LTQEGQYALPNLIPTPGSAVDQGHEHIYNTSFDVQQIDHAFEALAAARAQEGNNGWIEGHTLEEIAHIERICQASAQPGDVFDLQSSIRSSMVLLQAQMSRMYMRIGVLARGTLGILCH
jgi:hypothetical protein